METVLKNVGIDVDGKAIMRPVHRVSLTGEPEWLAEAEARKKHRLPENLDVSLGRLKYGDPSNHQYGVIKWKFHH